jgi:heptose I phosphotransferase
MPIPGGEELSKPRLGSRRRVRLDLTDDAGRRVRWYLKCYGPRAWPLRLWRRLSGQERGGPARREFDNIRRLAQAGIPTMRAVTFGQERDWLGVRRSYLVVASVPGEALERCGEDFLRRHADRPEVLEEFTGGLAELVRALHAAGLVHRDLYASHVFLEEAPGGPRLHLIDLARCFSPRWRKFRWQVKDLAALKYSMPPAWVQRYWQEFLNAYLLGPPDKMDAGLPGRFNRAIDRKVAWMRRRQRRKAQR